MEHESDGDIICGWHPWNNSQKIGKRTGRLGNKRTNRGHTNYSIIKNGQNSEESSGDLRRLVVTQTPVKNHQQTLV